MLAARKAQVLKWSPAANAKVVHHSITSEGVLRARGGGTASCNPFHMATLSSTKVVPREAPRHRVQTHTHTHAQK